MPFDIPSYLEAAEKMGITHKEAFEILKKTQRDFRTSRGVGTRAKVDDGSVANISWSRALKVAVERKGKGENRGENKGESK